MGPTAEIGRQLLVTAAALLRSRVLVYLLWLVGLLVQVVLVVLSWELVHVCVDVAEMWIALARKQFELTL